MFRRILVPVDGTEHSRQSVALACRLAKQFGGKVFLVRVQPLTTRARELATSTLALEALTEEVRQGGVECDSMLDQDSTVEGIVATATYRDSDLIVLAPHHRSWLEALRHPSVTEDMMAQSPAPLLIWPERMPTESVASFLAAPAAPVIVPLDGSDVAEQALPYATALAEQYGRSLLLVRVVPPVVLPSIGPQTTQLQARVREEEQEAARAYMQLIRERAGSEIEVAGAVQSMVLVGQPTAELLRLAEAHPDGVLVMTTHGRGRVGRALLGSVAADLIHRASIPMFVLRAGMTPATLDGVGASPLATHH
jgi:nucleotide-binding universal stress UspA family protein